MPLLPNPRKLKRGHFFYGQSKFGRVWRIYNTCCQSKPLAADVVAAVERYCADWERAERLLKVLREGRSETSTRECLQMVREEFSAGRDPLRNMERKETLFGELTEQYIRDRGTGWSASTAVSRRHTFRLWVTQFGDKPTVDISREQIQDFRDELQSRLSPHSVNIHLRNLRAFVNWASAEAFDGWKAPLIKEVRAPGSEHHDHLSPNELTSLLQVARGVKLNGEPLHDFYAFLASTGMRRGEALACNWEWIEGDFLLVPAASTKTQSKRFVPIIEPLRHILSVRPEPHSGRIFPQMSIEATRRFPSVCKAAGIARRLKLHNLRDTYVVRAIRAGIPTQLIASICGNSVRVIEQHYAHISREDLQGVAARLSQPYYENPQRIEKQLMD